MPHRVSRPFQARRGLPQAVEPEAFVRLLRACQLPGERGGKYPGMTARNRAILWLLWDTGLQVSELCRLRLGDVDRTSGTVTVRGKRGDLRTFPLSAGGQHAVCTYLDQARLTPAWEAAVPEARDRLLLTERRQPLTKNSLTLLFKRLSQRAGFTRTPICPSMLRDTYANRFLQGGGGLAVLREQLGVAALASAKRYRRFCEQWKEEREARASPEASMPVRQSQRGQEECHVSELDPIWWKSNMEYVPWKKMVKSRATSHGFRGSIKRHQVQKLLQIYRTEHHLATGNHQKVVR
jgi:site-specific recombinase XerD